MRESTSKQSILSSCRLWRRQAVSATLAECPWLTV